MAWFGNWFGVGAEPAVPAKSGDGNNSPRRASKEKASPRVVSPDAVASEVRLVRMELVQTTWVKLRSEFAVLEKVWASKAMLEDKSETKPKEDREKISVTFKAAFSASDQNPDVAVKMLETLVRDARSDQLTKPVVQLLRNSVRDTKRASLLSRLCKCLESATNGEQNADQMRDLESLVTSCCLDGQLESRIRKALKMASSKADIQQAQRKERESIACEKNRKVEQITQVAKVSAERAKKTLEENSGDADTAVVMILSEKDTRTEETAHSAEKKRQSRELDVKAFTDELTELAESVAILAESTHRLAWDKVRDEFEVQLKVWNDKAALVTAMGGSTRSYSAIEEEMMQVLAASSTKPEEAAMMLEMLLEMCVHNGFQICGGMLMAADSTLDIDRVMRCRLELAAALEGAVASITAAIVPTRSGGQESELQWLISSCDLGSSGLQPRVEKALESKRLADLLIRARRVEL